MEGMMRVGKEVNSNVLISRAGIEAVRSGEVCNFGLKGSIELTNSRALVHCDTWKVSDFLTQPCKAIKNRRFSGIGISGQGNFYRTGIQRVI